MIKATHKKILRPILSFNLKLGSVWEQTALLTLVVCILTACSPYIYQDEIELLDKGVDKSVETLNTYLSRAEEKRKKQRINSLKEAADANEKIGVSTGCLNLEFELENSLDNPLDFKVDENALSDCVILPVPIPSPGAIYPNISLLGKRLQDYTKALVEITNAQDREALVSATSGLTSTINGLIGEVNKFDGSESSDTAISSIGKVVQLGLTRNLDRRRFKTLKTTVNQAHPVVERIAILLEKAMTLMFLEDSSQQLKILNQKVLQGDGKKGDAFVQVWQDAQKEREKLIAKFRNNPSVILRSMVLSHKSLAKSLNNSSNKAQLGIVIQNVQNFYDAVVTLEETL